MIVHHFRLASPPSLHHIITPRPRPRRILQRPWSKYNLNPAQKSRLLQRGFLPKMEKRIRATDSDRTISPPNEIEITFLGTSAGDHVLGLLSFLSHIGDRADADQASENQHPFSDPSSVVEIFGPSGIREFVRCNLRLTKTHSLLKVKVNELLRTSIDEVFTPSLSIPTGGPGRLWHSEILGEDIWSDENGLWTDVIPADECGVSVKAAPIQHTVDCIGYLLTEVKRREKFDMVKLAPIFAQHADEIKRMGFKVLPAVLSLIEKTRKPICFSTGVRIEPPELSIRGRRIMILGDTSDPGAMDSLLKLEPDNHPVDLLIHEATGTSVPDAHELRQKQVLPERQMARKMRERGHSTSFMAGQFAHRVGAHRLILNHLGGKFPGPQGNLRPSKSSPGSELLFSNSGATEHQSGLKQLHAKLWKSLEENHVDHQAILLKHLDWLEDVKKDALRGWKQASLNSSASPTTTTSNLVNSPSDKPLTLEVSIAYDFMQLKIPRTDRE